MVEYSPLLRKINEEDSTQIIRFSERLCKNNTTISMPYE